MTGTRIILVFVLMSMCTCTTFAAQRDSVLTPEPTAAAGKDRVIATLPGEVAALYPGSANGIAVLMADQRLVLLDGKAAPRTIALPKMPADAKTTSFCSLAVRGNEVAFCHYQDPRLFVLDLQNPTRWRVVTLKNLPQENPRFMAVGHTAGSAWTLRDCDGHVYSVDAAGQAALLPDGAVETNTGKLGHIQVSSQIGGADAVKSWRIVSDKGNTLYAITDGKPETNCVGLQVLGTNPRGQLVVLTTTRARDRSDVYEIRVIADQKVVARQRIPSAEKCPGVRNEVLLGDGTVCIVRPADSGSGSVLRVVSL